LAFQGEIWIDSRWRRNLRRTASAGTTWYFCSASRTEKRIQGNQPELPSALASMEAPKEVPTSILKESPVILFRQSAMAVPALSDFARIAGGYECDRDRIVGGAQVAGLNNGRVRQSSTGRWDGGSWNCGRRNCGRGCGGWNGGRWNCRLEVGVAFGAHAPRAMVIMTRCK